MDIIYIKLTEIYKNKKLNISDLSVLVVNAMQLAEKYEKNNKKAVVLDVLKNFVEKSDSADKETFMVIINTVVPGMIDRLIDVNNGGITFGKKTCCW